MMPSPNEARSARGFLLCSGVFLLLFLSSCAGFQQRADQEKEEERYQRHPLLLIERVQEVDHKLQSLRGMADVDITSPHGALHARTALVLQHPGLLRLEALSPLGQTVMLFTADHQYLSLYMPGEGKFFRGNPSPETLFALLGLPLELPMMTTFLRGRVPLGMPEASHLKVTSLNDQSYQLHTLFSTSPSSVQREVIIDKRTFSPQQYREYTASGMLILEVRYDQFRSVDNIFIPFHQQIRFPTAEVTAEIEILRTSLNIEVTADLFQLIPPRKIPITWLTPEAWYTQ
jgi:outer membrane lipoprotein-sorting protein